MTDLAAMQKRIDDLEFENGELRAALSSEDIDIPEKFGMTRCEERVLRVLIKRDIASRLAISLALWDAIDIIEKNPQTVAVHICKMRRKLKPLGVVIDTHWGRGWSLDAESRRKFGRVAA